MRHDGSAESEIVSIHAASRNGVSDSPKRPSLRIACISEHPGSGPLGGETFGMPTIQQHRSNGYSC